MDDITVQKRIDTWRDRLLDLTLRNRQLNYVFNKSTLKVSPKDQLNTLNELFSEKSLEIVCSSESGEDVSLSQRQRVKLSRRLITDCSPDRLSKTYIKLFRDSERLELERGYRSLYLSVGFVSWYESESSDVERLSPAILIPVKLGRQSRSSKGFSVSLSADDDPLCVNESMLKKFEVEFGISMPSSLSPHDLDYIDSQEQQGTESKLDTEDNITEISLMDRVDRYLDAVDQMLKNHSEVLKRWSLKRELWGINLLDFAKGVMWRDLSSLLDTQDSQMISQLLSGGAGASPSCSVTQLERLDDPPQSLKARLYPLLPFDPSQQQAILAAMDGGTFVLQGPPGTGKSQTITQMIGQLIASGKRVLFVSEKRAALDVVYRRLNSLNLDPFVLNAHSHKSKKRELIEELWRPMLLSDEIALENRRTQGQKRKAEKAFDQCFRDHQSLKEELNRYTLLMSQPTIWETVVGLPQTNYELLESVVALRYLRDDSCFQSAEKSIHSDLKSGSHVQELLGRSGLDLSSLMTRYENLRSVLPSLSACRRDVWTPIWNQELDEILSSYKMLMEWTTAKWGALKLPKLSLTSLPDLLSYLEVLIELDPSHPIYQQSRINQFNTQQTAYFNNVLGQLQPLHNRLVKTWRPELWLHPDLASIRGAFIKWSSAWSPLRFFMLFSKRRTLRSLQLDNLERDDAQYRDELVDLITHKELKEEYHSIAQGIAHLIGPHWRAENTDIEVIKSLFERGETVQTLYHKAKTSPKLSELLQSIESLRSQTGTKHLIDLHKALSQWSQIHDMLVKHGNFSFTDLDQEREPAEWVTWCDYLLSQRGHINRLCSFNRELDQLKESGWSALSEIMRNAELSTAHVEALIRIVSYERQWSLVCSRSPEITQFSVSVRENNIQRFNTIDERINKVAQEEVISKLLTPLPDITMIKSRRTTKTLNTLQDWQEAGLSTLKREFEKKSRHKPLRELFQTCAEAITLLKPCVCMSPLSVAHFLPLSRLGEAPLFDVVIFDEASQLRPWDAIGAIARAKQAVIVGDSKQLPPTNFFQSNALDEALQAEADEGFVEDLESILDEALAARFKEMTLRWHYRSRHESLIAFSNFMYYQNKLHTFPSAELAHRSLGVQFIKVDGLYDRGKSRTNRVEAQKVVTELFSFLQGDNPPTVGVVTFSQAQQSLIEDLIDAERIKQPDLEHHFAPDHPEPVFVKNLETVQGDERDIIFFSICYGPEAQGRIYHNFGPLNRTGGERRLNVAVTRARRAMIVISSMTADMLDSRKLNATGAAHLKTFLNYAQHGPSALESEADVLAEAKTESPFEEQVYRFLISKGYEVVPQVGVAGYRVDLGIIDPERPGRFMLGVECDGATYHSSRVARERDILRQQVLEGLGWTIHRIWSTDWWIDPRPQQEKLLERLRGIVQR